MDSIQITTSEIVQFMLIVGMLLIGLFALRIFFQLTLSLLRVGCVLIIIIGALLLLLAIFN